MFFNHTRKLGLSSPSRISTTGFPTYHSYGFLLRRNTTTPIGLCYRTVGSLNLLMATSTEGTSLSLPTNQLESLLSWTGHKRDGIQTTGSTVRHSTLVGTRTSGDETGSTTFLVHACENSRSSQSIQWQWARCKSLLPGNARYSLIGEIGILRRKCKTHVL